MRKTVLLCYPRSGSTFTTEIVKFLNYESTLVDLEGRDEKLMESPFNFDQHTAAEFARAALFEEKFVKLHGHNGQSCAILNSWLNIGTEKFTWPIDDLTHHRIMETALSGGPWLLPQFTEPETQEAALLLLLLRDPAETFTSHRARLLSQEVLEVDYFYKNLKTYELYGGPKAVIYYEDLIEDPNKYVHDLCVLLDIPFEAGTKFMRDYDEHFDSCRETYTHKHGPPRTDGRTAETTMAQDEQFWEVFVKKCEEFNVPEGRTLCERYYKERYIK
jgi:hypothetical protein